MRRVLALLPEPVRFLINKHRELIRFAVVGGTTFVIDNGVWYALKLTVLQDKVVTAKAIAVLVAVISSYVLSREWSFHTRGGRERHHEAALFFLISGIGVAVYTAPLAISRYVFDLAVPNVSLLTQEIADFVSGWLTDQGFVVHRLEATPGRPSLPGKEFPGCGQGVKPVVTSVHSWTVCNCGVPADGCCPGTT